MWQRVGRRRYEIPGNWYNLCRPFSSIKIANPCQWFSLISSSCNHRPVSFNQIILIVDYHDLSSLRLQCLPRFSNGHSLPRSDRTSISGSNFCIIIGHFFRSRSSLKFPRPAHIYLIIGQYSHRVYWSVEQELRRRVSISQRSVLYMYTGLREGEYSCSSTLLWFARPSLLLRCFAEISKRSLMNINIRVSIWSLKVL